MAAAKKTQIVITANAAVAKKVMDELQQRIDGIKQKMAALDVTTKQGQREFKKLEKELVSYNSAVTQNITNTERIDKAMKNLSGTSLNELKRALSAAKSELGKMSASDKGLKQMQGNVNALQAQIDKLTGSVHKQGNAWQTALKNLTAYVGLFGAFNMIKSKLTDILKLNFQYSDSLANVRKVSNLSMESVNDLSRQLAKIDSRTSLEGLTQLAYVGSRMGMGKYGASGLAEFAAASDRVNVALKEDLGDDAMLTLSKFVETMGEVEKHGGNISDAFDSVSSSIFKLASTSTANGGNILEFAKRLTGLSKVSHITSDQLLGLASASDSLMLMPEVASTAFGKLISSLWTNYHDIEKMLGMQEDSLKDMMSKGETMQALVTVLQNVSDKNLNSMDEYFKEFGSDGQRLKSVVVTMAQNVDVLKSHLDESSKAYKDATAVSKEYAIQQETAQAIIERANNMWNKAFVNPEGIDSVKEIAKVWYDFSKTLTQSTPFMRSAKILMWEIKTSVEMLLKILPGLVAYMGTRGLVWAFSKLLPLMIGVSGSGVVKFFTLLTMAVHGNAVAVRLLHIRWTAMTLAMKANVIGFAISAIATLGTWIYSLVKNTDNATKSVEQFDRSLTGVRNKANQAVGELDAYYRAIKRAKKGSFEYQAAIKVYNDKFGVYFKKLERENGMVKDLAASYREAAKAIRAKMYVQMEQDDRDKFVKPRAGRSLDRLGEYGQIAPEGFEQEMLEAYTKDSYGKQMNVVVKELAQRFGVKDVSNVLASENRGLTKAVRREKVRKRSLFGDPYYVYEDKDVSANEQQLFRALRYVRQERATHNTELGIDKKYEPVRKQMDNYILSTTGGNEDLNVPDESGKNGKTGSGRNGNENKKEEQQTKARANALIANIKAFYEEQMRKYLEWVAQMNADGEKVSEGQQKEQLDYLQSQMDRALGTARQSITNLGDGWKEFYSHMDEDVMVYDEETSKQLLDSIGKTDVGELHKLFTKLSGDLSRENNKSLAENLGALLDQIFANGSKELREAAEKLLARQREIQKILNEHDYTGAVDRNTRGNFDRLGFLQPAKDIRADSPEGLEKMNAAFDKLTTKARESITVLYSLNPESENFQNRFLQFLSVADEGFDFSALKAQDLKALYLELIKYNDEYESASKKRDDERKKLNDYAWSNTDYYKEYQKALPGAEQEVAVKGSYRNAGQRMGMESVSALDPELELMKARMEFAQQYYTFLEEHNATEQQLADARKSIMMEQANYAKKLTGDMFEQYNSLLTFMGPLQTFGESVGDAFVTMTENAAEGRKALKTALKQMIKSFATNTLQMISQQQIDRAQTTAHYTQLLLMQQAFGTAKVAGEAATGVALLTTKTVNNQTEEQLEVAHQQAMAALRSAGIFGWCVSTLGPVAGPIAYAAMMAILMGLLNFAISKVGGSDNSNNSNAKSSNTKIVSGMLTYDSGNVQDLRPFVGNDGSLYWATEDDKPHNGVSLLTQPTATSINGQPSLVAENGPELVIGRETTQAMMMNNPQLLKALVNYDRNYSGRRAYDTGNIAETSPTVAAGSTVSDEMVSYQAKTNVALLQAVNTLLQRLEQPIEAKIDMYGRGKLYDSMTKANQFMKNK
jgi:TP901 family phage tail tape measure protein